MSKRTEIRRSSRAAAIASLLVITAFAPSAMAQRTAQAPGQRTNAEMQQQQKNPVIQAYLRAVQGAWMPVDARARLQAIDTSGAERGAYRSLAFIASDRAARQFAPAALDAAGRPFEASALRQIATFSDEAGVDLALAKVGTVLETVRGVQRPNRNLTAAIASLQAAREALTHAKAQASVLGEDRQASLHATRAARSSARAAQQAVRAGADGYHVSDLVVQSFADMVAAARNPTSTPVTGPDEHRSNMQQPRGEPQPSAQPRTTPGQSPSQQGQIR